MMHKVNTAVSRSDTKHIYTEQEPGLAKINIGTWMDGLDSGRKRDKEKEKKRKI